MNKNIIEILQESIVSIYDEFDNIIEYSKLELILKKKTKTKYILYLNQLKSI